MSQLQDAHTLALKMHVTEITGTSALHRALREAEAKSQAVLLMRLANTIGLSLKSCLEDNAVLAPALTKADEDQARKIAEFLDVTDITGTSDLHKAVRHAEIGKQAKVIYALSERTGLPMAALTPQEIFA